MIPSISVEELHARLNAGEKLFVLDVRQPEEHAQYRILDGPLIPLGELMDRKSELDAQREETMYIYCRSGNRSGQATEYLNYLGYNCVNVRGGILAWQSMMEKNV